MPFIVVLIDELADLMMLNAKEVEAPIARLTQLSCWYSFGCCNTKTISRRDYRSNQS